MFNFKELETFVWVAHLGGFRAAAEKLNTTQPSVSTRIAQIEGSLGVVLFERGPRGTTLTSKGRELLGYAERLLALREEVVAVVGSPGAVRGTVRLGSVETIGYSWLPELIERVREKFPLVTLEVDVDTTPQLRERLLSGRIDLAFLLGPFSEPWTATSPLSSYPLAWVARPDLDLPPPPLSVAALRAWPVMTYARNSRHNVAVKELLTIPGEPAPLLYAHASLSTIVKMTVSGVGIAVVPPILVRRELEEGRLVVLEAEPTLDAMVFVAAVNTMNEHPAVRSIVSMAQEIAQSKDHAAR